ncbi:MAG TPA: carboxypeptidase regulatory-like domain-containing protein [Thermoanaerobaculia bacterium]|jgi:protocatechuate 3,4-dioxygenase beta subunit|nr:carboxypeptidase regulatory-like domain-containing protein [Thermoanaerobaculia bacterium]
MLRLLLRFLLGIALLASPCTAARAAEIPVEGEVLGVGGTSLPGVRVELRPALSRYEAGMLELAGEEPAPVAQDVTSVLGRFRLSAPRAGLWRLVARANGYVPMETPVFSVFEEEERSLPAVTLRPDRGLRVRVVESYGKPIPGVRVLGQTEKAALWGAWWQPSARQAVSGPDGGLRLSRAAGEPLRLWAAGPAFPAQGDVVADKGDAILLLQRGEQRFLIAREADDRAAPEALFRDSRTSLLLGRFDGKLPQPLALTAPATGLWDLRIDLADGRQVFPRIDEAHRPAETTLIRVILTPAAPVAGRIVDASSRRPIAGALVWASDDPGFATWTDAAGTYKLSGRVPESHWWLQAVAADYAANFLQVGPPLGSSAGLPRIADLTLAPAPVPAITGVVVDEAARPVGGAEVVLVDPEASPQQWRRVSTSPAGSFRIRGLQAGGSYTLTASRSGFAPATLLATVPLPTQTQAAIRLTLRRGRTASGLVVDPRQRPISGAAVRLTTAKSKWASRARPELGPFRAATDPDGRFRIPDLPAGLFELRIEGPELAPLPKKMISVPGGKGPLDLGTFTLESRARIAGWIVDPGDRPVESVEIWVVPEDYAEITQATHQAGPATVSGPDGRFELRERAVGDHERLRACRKGYSPAEFPVKRPASTEPRIVLTPTVHLAGHVVGADGEPLPGATVSAWPTGQERGDLIMPDPPCPSSFFSSALTDAKGDFIVELGGAGHYEVAASGAGHLSTRLERLHVPAEGLDGLQVRMEAGVTVNGHVADPEGQPVVGAAIRLSGGRSSVAAASDDGGDFLLEGVEPGERSVDVRHDDFATEERKVQIRPEGTRLDLVLHPVSHLEIRGRVIGPDGAPVAGALVTKDRCQCQSTSTLADGSFLLPGDKGAHELVAEKDGFAPTETGDITVENRSIDGVEIRLSYGLTLTGRVLGIDPAAVSKILVRVVAGSLREIQGAIDSEGRFEVPHLPPGKWDLYAQAGDRYASVELTPPAGLTEVVHDLQFPPVAEVRGRVTGPGGEPIEGASLWFSGNTYAHFQAQTLADGSFAVGVTDGTYTLSVSAEGYSSREAERPIVVEGAPVEDVEIQLGPNIVLTGRLLGLEPGETVHFQAVGPPSYRPGPCTSDDEGHYRQTGLWPGDWTIIAGYTSGTLLYGSPERLATGKVHIPSGTTEATLDLDFRMGDLTLTVRSAHPNESFLAALLNADGSALIKNAFGQGGVSSQDGVVRFERLQAGTYRLRIQDQRGKQMQDQPIELTADREVVIDPAVP